jgi:hypothetical protein
VEKFTKHAFWASAGVFVLLLGIYALSYSGFPVSDDEQLFAAVSQSIARGRGPEAPQLYGNNRLLGEFTGSGPLHVYIGAAVLRLVSGFGVGEVQALYLLSPLYTALTAALLVLIVRGYGFTLRTAAVTGLLFGLSTIAWPYSQTFFREPLAMLLLAAAWLCLLLALEKHVSRNRRVVFGVFGVLAFIGALLTKVLLLAVLPAFVYLLWSRRSPGLEKMILIGGVVLLTLAAAFSVLAPQSRLSLDFFERLWRLRRGFPYREIPQALLEMLFSPGRGLLVYSPVFLLLPLAWVKAGKHHRQPVVFSLLAAAGLMLAQAAAYGSEWWGITWGTRSLLPVLPLLAAGFAPAVEHLLNSTRIITRGLLWGLAGLGALIQLGGVLVSNSAYTLDLYYTQLVPDIGEVVWSYQHAPLLAHWRLLGGGAEANSALLRVFADIPLRALVVLAGCALLVVGGIFALRGALTRKEGMSHWMWGLAVVLAALPALMLTGYRVDPRYGGGRGDVQALADVIEDEVQPGDVILVFPYLRTPWNYFMNFYRGDADWFSLPNTFPYGDMASTISLVDDLGENYSRVWLVAETATWEPQSPFVEGYLTQFGEVKALAVFEPVDPNLQLRLVLYELDGTAGD